MPILSVASSGPMSTSAITCCIFFWDQKNIQFDIGPLVLPSGPRCRGAGILCHAINWVIANSCSSGGSGIVAQVTWGGFSFYWELGNLPGSMFSFVFFSVILTLAFSGIFWNFYLSFNWLHSWRRTWLIISPILANWTPAQIKSLSICFQDTHKGPQLRSPCSSSPAFS